MNRIKGFESFSKNEELFHGTSKEQTGSSSKTMQKAGSEGGRFLGNIFGIPTDILDTYLKSKVKDGVITDAQKKEIEEMLNFDIREMKRSEIKELADAEIKKMVGSKNEESSLSESKKINRRARKF